MYQGSVGVYQCLVAKVMSDYYIVKTYSCTPGQCCYVLLNPLLSKKMSSAPICPCYYPCLPIILCTRHKVLSKIYDPMTNPKLSYLRVCSGLDNMKYFGCYY